MGAQKYVKVLVQEFAGTELIEPNAHYSKCLILYNTNPAEVMQEFKEHLASKGLVHAKKSKKSNKGEKRHLTPESRASKIAKMKAYWAGIKAAKQQETTTTTPA